MASFKRQGPGIKKLVVALEKSSIKAQVGWFPGAKYADGTPVAYVAAIQEFGSVHTHPGGTKYIIGEGGKAVFVSNDYPGQIVGRTKPHQIVIPPRSFMRTTIAEKEKSWAKIVKSGSKAMLAGNATQLQVMEGLSLAVSGDIRKKISEISSPPLKAGTIASRKRKLSEGKKVGSLNKPLVESGFMITSLSSTVESK